MDLAQCLIGTWRTDPEDRSSVERFGSVFLRFGEGGSLEYAIESEDKYQVIVLRYQVDGSELVTDQPSAPREERTCFRFASDDRLLLERDGYWAVYVRSDDDQPWRTLDRRSSDAH